MKKEKTHNPLQNNVPEDHYDIFLSYKSEDSETALQLKAAIEAFGYKVFYDHQALEGSANWQKTIIHAIENCHALVFSRTDRSVQSQYCHTEVNKAKEKEKRILPVSFLHQKDSLPSNPALSFALDSIQTTFISDFSNINTIQNELKTALFNAIKQPADQANRLLIVEFMRDAGKILSARHHDTFKLFECKPRISPDVNEGKITLKWQFSIAEIPAALVIVLNESSKRPVCFNHCQQGTKAKDKQCPYLLPEPGGREYSIEAYLDTMEYERTSLIEKCLIHVLDLPKTCGNHGVKYFFRKKILPELKVDPENKFQAMLTFLEEALHFYDKQIKNLTEFLEFTTDVCKVLRDEKILSNILNKKKENSSIEWEECDESKENGMLHFFRKNSSSTARLGELCSVALRYPEALRLKLTKCDCDEITLTVFRFKEGKQKNKTVKYKRSEWEEWKKRKKVQTEVQKKLQEAVDPLLNWESLNDDETKHRYSSLPVELHAQLADFIEANPQLQWEVSQHDRTQITVVGYFQSAPQTFSQVRFALELTWHGGKQTVDWKPSIISDSDENKAVLSDITGYSVGEKMLKASTDVLQNCFNELTNSLQGIHNEVYKIYTALHKIDDELLCTWRPYKAATVLTLNNNTENASYINASQNDETCWEYYLSSGTRLCRRLRDKDYPLMFNIRFSSAGACNATIGWYGDRSFKKLSFLEKKLFWHYVLSQFPENLRNSFACRENEIFLTDDTAKKDLEARKPKLFQDATAVEAELEIWQPKNTPDSLMEQMFQSIEKAVKEFNIYTDKKTKA